MISGGTGANPYQDLLKRQNNAAVQSAATAYSQSGGMAANARATPPAKETTYYDPNGKEQTGYIIDGKTYTDANGTTSVGVGSKVETGGGWYLKGENGSTLIPNPKTETGGGNYGGGGFSANDGYYGRGGATTNQPNIKQVQGIVGGRGQTVYIINGQTYLDRNGTQRLGLGDRVQTDNGWYEMGASGGVKIGDQIVSESDVLDPKTGEWSKVSNINGVTNAPNGSLVYTKNGVFIKGGNGKALSESEVRQMEDYGNLQKASKDALMAARNAGVTQLNQQLPGINGNYDNLAKQAYTNYALENKAMPEQMAKLGLAGQGISETTAARLTGNYQSNLNNSEIARRTAIQQVNNDIANLMAGSEVDIAKSKLTIQQDYMNAYERMLANEESKRQFELQYNDNQEDKLYNRKQDQLKSEEAKAFEIAEVTGDYSVLLKFGYSQGYVDEARKQWVQERNAAAYAAASGASGGSGTSSRAKGRSTGGGNSGKVKKAEVEKEPMLPKLGYSQMMSKITESGNPVLELKELAKNYSISSSDYAKLEQDATNAVDKMFEDDMREVERGRITYAQLRDKEQALAAQWDTVYGTDRYLLLLNKIIEKSGVTF